MLLKINLQTASIHLGKNYDQVRGYINNKQQDWSFPVDAVSVYYYIVCLRRNYSDTHDQLQISCS